MSLGQTFYALILTKFFSEKEMHKKNNKKIKTFFGGGSIVITETGNYDNPRSQGLEILRYLQTGS